MRLITPCSARYLGYIAFLCAVACSASPTHAGSAQAGTSTYASKIITIDKLAGEIVAQEALLASEPFIELASEGAKNIDECIRLLGAQVYTWQQRMIAIFSMHKLGAHEYSVFLRKLADLFDKGLVSSVELGTAVVPTFAFSTVLIENYAEGDVQLVLREIAARDGIRPATKSAIEGILSGAALEDWKSFRRNCCSGPEKK